MASPPDWSHQIVLQCEAMSAGRARDFVSLHLAAHRLSHLVEDIRLVASELATNAMDHARTPFVVTLSMTGGTVLLGVQDGSDAIPVRSASDCMDVHGRGLVIVESLSREWGVGTDDRGFKSVWATFP